MGVNASQVIQNSFLPIAPIFLEKQAAVLGRGTLSATSRRSRPSGPQRCEASDAWQRRIPAWAILGQPGKFQARLARQMFEGKIRRQPRGIHEIVHRREPLDDVRGEKSGSGEDDHPREILAFAGADA